MSPLMGVLKTHCQNQAVIMTNEIFEEEIKALNNEVSKQIMIFALTVINNYNLQ